MGLLSLLFPHQCSVCDYILFDKQSVLCINCQANIPYTLCRKNKAVERKLPHFSCIKKVTSLLSYDKASNYSRLFYLLKYHKQRQIGIYLGTRMGEMLKRDPDSKSIDFILPVPLHPKKEKIRGYNQSLLLAEGVSSILHKPIANDILYKSRHETSQTSKNATERAKSVHKIFQLTTNAPQYSNCHLLLIDDIVTTGSTLCSCIESIEQINNITVSVVTAATTE